MNKIRKYQQQMLNRCRADGVFGVSKILQATADSVEGTAQDDLRRGLLLAAGICSAVGGALRSGGNELGVIDVEGDLFPVEFVLRVEDG